jgi:hypothetical protein
MLRVLWTFGCHPLDSFPEIQFSEVLHEIENVAMRSTNKAMKLVAVGGSFLWIKLQRWTVIVMEWTLSTRPSGAASNDLHPALFGEGDQVRSARQFVYEFTIVSAHHLSQRRKN